MKTIWVLTLFPSYFNPLKEVGVIGSALRGERGEGPIQLKTVQISQFSPKNFKGVDEAPYGGGAGMVMRADVLQKAILEGVVTLGQYGEDWKEKLHIVCPAPRGKSWSDKDCREFASKYLLKETSKDVVFICGRYEGIDERFLENYVDQFISLGNFVLSGGEIPVMAFIDSAMRMIPGVLGNNVSTEEESFASPEIEQPQFTRPAEFEGKKVPDVLLSGNHKKIDEFREVERKRMTKKYRPDLLEE